MSYPRLVHFNGIANQSITVNLNHIAAFYVCKTDRDMTDMEMSNGHVYRLAHRYDNVKMALANLMSLGGLPSSYTFEYLLSGECFQVDGTIKKPPTGL